LNPMKIMLDPGHWQENVCMLCGKTFYVRLCYVKRGQGKFCSTSCGTRFRNLINNPTLDPQVRKKVSLNHADVSGSNNPMFGKRGNLAPSYIDGRNKLIGDTGRRIALTNLQIKCVVCGETQFYLTRRLHVHHKDKNRKNNDLSNLEILCVKCHNTIRHQNSRDLVTGRFVKEEVMPDGVNENYA